MNLSICQVCKQNPAVYGDGVTWSRCAECELNNRDVAGIPEPESPTQPVSEDGFEHKTIPGLTSIIIPVYMLSYTLFHYTGNCIGAVREHTNPEQDPYEIIIVDNGSPIQPPELNSYYADKVIQNKENLGFTKAVNQGIRMAFGEYIVVLNNDTQVFNNWLPVMKKALNNGLDLVMSAPMYSKTEPFARALEAKREQMKYQDWEIEKTYTDGRDFSCVAFKKELMNEIGNLDEQFFNYCSDVDLLKRMDIFGKKFAQCKAVPIHHISDATGFSIGETPEIMNEDKAKYAAKWTPEYEAEFKVQMGGDHVIAEESGSAVPSSVAVEQPPEIKRDDLVRTPETGDAIFFIKDGKHHHIKDPDTLRALGGDFGQDRMISRQELSETERGETIDMTNVEKYNG